MENFSIELFEGIFLKMIKNTGAISKKIKYILYMYLKSKLKLLIKYKIGIKTKNIYLSLV